MKTVSFILLTFFICQITYSQVYYEKGYYIDEINQKVDCLIRNVDWKNSPTDFEYKLSDADNPQRLTIQSVKEFSIYNSVKYVKSTVNIDKSSDQVSNLSIDKNPIFQVEVLFLKVLIEGKANLYSYENGNLVRYFYNYDGLEIRQLIYKRYLKNNNMIAVNNGFRVQLWNDLKCPKFTMSKIENLGYNKNALIDFFEEYNNCLNTESKNFEKKQKVDLLNITVRPGINYSSLFIDNSLDNTEGVDFDKQFTGRFGLEVELIMPFNKNKWSIFAEPTYQYFSSSGEDIRNTITADYKSIELPIGIRHYMFLNDNSKIFINGAFVVDFSTNSTIDFSIVSDLEIKTGTNVALGMGFKFKDKISLELRYQTSRDILAGYFFWESKYNTTSLIFGYSIF